MSESTREPTPELQARINAIAERYLESLENGSVIDRTEVLNAHPEIRETLEWRLNTVEALFRARANPTEDAYRLSCPNCAQTLQIVVGVGEEAQCDHCGSSFRIDPIREPAGRDLPVSIGRFEVVDLLGRGSFGLVYEAIDPELNRTVAVKAPRSGSFCSAEEEERFFREARSAAGLKHPGIVQVHEVVEGSLPHIVCDYVEGGTIEDLVGDATLDPHATADLVAQIADALGYAHRHKIVHRDVKPSNVLLDLAGRPHLTDFGLARHDGGEITVTLDGQILGTPAYMAPEQARGEPHNVDARSDVYGLGVILYELLTGERPFTGQRSMLLNQVIHDEPRSPRRLNERISLDLETVCLKAMAKERSRRYETADAFADDLRRFLRGEPVLARPVSNAERLWRWSRRNPALAGLSAALMLLLGAVVVSSVVAAVYFEDLAGRATREQLESNRRLVRLHVRSGIAESDQGEFLRALPYLVEALSRYRGDVEGERGHRVRLGVVLAHCPRLVQMWFHDTSVNHAVFSPDGSLVAIASTDGTARVWSVASGEAASPLLRHDASVWRLAFHPDGHSLLTSSFDGAARLWDWARGELAVGPLRHGDVVWPVAFSRDGTRALSASKDGTTAVWDAKTGARLLTLEHPRGVHIATFHPAGQRILTACSDGVARLWSGENGNLLRTFPRAKRGLVEAEFSGDGRLLVIAERHGSARVFDVESAEEIESQLGLTRSVKDADFSPDGKRLVLARNANTAEIVDPRTGRALVPSLFQGFSQAAVTYSPDGARVAIASGDGAVIIWDPRTGERLGPPLRHGESISRIAFGPSARRLLVVTDNGTVSVWDLARRQPRVPALHVGGRLGRVEFSRDGHRLLLSSEHKSASIWDAEKATPIAWLRLSPVRRLDVCPQVDLVATISEDRRATIWSIPDGDPVHVLELENPGRHVRFSPRGDLLATVATGGVVRLWNVETGEPTGFVVRSPPEVRSVEFSADGGRLVIGNMRGQARIWDSSSGEAIGPVLDNGAPIHALAMHADGRRVVSGAPRLQRVWDGETGEVLAAFERNRVTMRALQFDPRGERVLVGDAAGVAYIWEASTGKPVTPAMVHPGQIFCARFDPSGRWVGTGTGELGSGTARVWDARSGEPVTQSLVHADRADWVAFSPDGRRFATACYDGAARVWDLVEERRPVEALRLVSRLLSGMKLNPSTDGLEFLDREELRAAWAEARRSLGEEFSVQPSEAIDWHWKEYLAARRLEAWNAAILHLDRLIELEPGDWRHHNRRGVANRKLGRIGAAMLDGARALQRRAAEVGEGFHGGPDEDDAER